MTLTQSKTQHIAENVPSSIPTGLKRLPWLVAPANGARDHVDMLSLLGQIFLEFLHKIHRLGLDLFHAACRVQYDPEEMGRQSDAFTSDTCNLQRVSERMPVKCVYWLAQQQLSHCLASSTL